MGIFNMSGLYTRYHGQIRFRDKVMGGIPRSPEVIEAWLRGKAKLTDELEITAMMVKTLYERGVDVAEGASYDEVVEASKALAGKDAVGFKRDCDGL